jgi:hypothetical protein
LEQSCRFRTMHGLRRRLHDQFPIKINKRVLDKGKKIVHTP